MDLDLFAEVYTPETGSGIYALDIYAQDLFLSKTHSEITDELDGLETTVYIYDDQVVGVSSVDLGRSFMGEVVLEYLAVDENQQGNGFGEAILDIVKQEALGSSDIEPTLLYVTKRNDTIEYYTDRGAIEDDDGSVYFELSE